MVQTIVVVMISDYVKKFELWVKKCNKNERLEEDRYWKLPATERMHYDSCEHKIQNDNFGLLNLTFWWIKLSVFIPAFMIIAALFTNQLQTIVPLAQGVFKTLISSTKIIFFADIIQFIVFASVIIPSKMTKLRKRFKLIKDKK